MDLRGVDIEALPEELGAFSPGAGIDWLVALIAPEGLQEVRSHRKGNTFVSVFG